MAGSVSLADFFVNTYDAHRGCNALAGEIVDAVVVTKMTNAEVGQYRYVHARYEELVSLHFLRHWRMPSRSSGHHCPHRRAALALADEQGKVLFL